MLQRGEIMFKEKLKKFFDTKCRIAAFVCSLIWFVLYFALGSAIFKNMWNTSPAMPIVGGIIAITPILAECMNILFFKNKWLDIGMIVVSLLFCLLFFFMFAFVLSKLNYFLITGVPYFITIGLLAIIVFFAVFYPKLHKDLKKVTAVGLALIIFIICLTCLFNVTPFYISGGATVFAVEDEYQIAFSTSHNSIGAIEIDGATYYDQTDGENNVSKLHKISVPSEVLDAKKNYSIKTQSVMINSAYLPSKGRVITQNYTFRPIDESDGIQIYNLSDTHECVAGPSKAASYFGDKLDLLILNGDIVNDISSEYQISLIYKLANRITNGSVPVIFTRGNHECNGKLAADLSKYVGSTENGMYYTFNIGSSVSMLVLDTNNDMGDDHTLISPLANFDQVRKAQSEWIKQNADWNQGFTHSFVIAHMAYPLSGYQEESCGWHDWAKELVELTNGKTDLAICGHSHRTDFIKPGTEDNKIADFPVLRGSLRSNKFGDREGVSPNEFTGTAIEIIGDKINIKYTNSKNVVMQEFTLN